MYKKIFIVLVSLLSCFSLVAQPKDMKYKVISSDEIATISYGTTISETQSGNHVVWVKADYHDFDWQKYFASQIGSKTLVTTTLTKASYNSYLWSVRCFCIPKIGNSCAIQEKMDQPDGGMSMPVILLGSLENT